MRPRVLVTEPEYRKAQACFTSERRFDCLSAPEDEAGLAAAAGETRCRHVIVGLRGYTGPLYDALQPGGVIARFGVGHDGIDKTKATKAGLLCTNTPGVLNQSVAEHTMLLVAAAARKLIVASSSMAKGMWVQTTGDELAGKTVAIVGCGAIGGTVARIAALAYGMRVIGYSRSKNAGERLEHFDLVTNDFAEAVRDAHFVSLHIPARPDNRMFIDRERLSQFRADAWLINTARGSVVDEAALYGALAEGRLGGAALDVFEHEPYAPAVGSGDLRSLANVILTPHVGGNTTGSNRRVAERALQNIALAEAGDFAGMDLLNREAVSRLPSQRR